MSSPIARAVVDKKVRDITELVLIKYPRFDEIFQCFQKSFDSAREQNEPWCRLLIGPSKVGKSTIGRHFYDQHSPIERDWGTERPVLWIRVHSQASIGALAETMLQELKEPYPSRGRIPDLSQRLDGAIEDHNVQLVVLNEAQHIIDSRHGVPYDVADWLKDRIEGTNVPFILIGLEYCQALIDENEQLRGLFDEPIEMSAFDWDVDHDRTTYRGFLKKLKVDLAEAYQLPNLDEIEFAGRLWYASFGLIGYTMRIVRGAAKIARDKRSITITEAMLAESYRDHVRGKNSREPNPFASKFNIDTAPAFVPPRDAAEQRRIASAARSGRAPRLTA